MFSQDFELFQTAAHPKAPPRPAPSHDTTLRRSFNKTNATFQGNGILVSFDNLQSLRPPVPLFHSNCTGHLPASHNHPVPDSTRFAMGGAGNSPYLPRAMSQFLITTSEVNVAYDGTFGDLGAGGDAALFNYDYADECFDFELLPSNNSFSSLDSAKGAIPGTVSPKDLFNDSVPPSTAFTNLTTPGSTFLDTPADDYEASPLFDGMATDNKWFSLFPDAEATAPPMKRTSSSQILVHPGGEGNPRKRSSTQTSPTFSPIVKHSDVAGIAARKRDKPLPPIVVDEADPVALKRARNTAAARKSRAKKVMEKDDLEGQISELKSQVAYWKAKALAHGAADE